MLWSHDTQACLSERWGSDELGIISDSFDGEYNLIITHCFLSGLADELQQCRFLRAS